MKEGKKNFHLLHVFMLKLHMWRNQLHLLKRKITKQEIFLNIKMVTLQGPTKERVQGDSAN